MPVRESDNMTVRQQSGHDPATGRLLRLATYASVSVAAVLAAVKIVAWLHTDSVAMLSSTIDSLLDLVASVVTLFAIRHALVPADREHRFGHGKAEPLAGLGQALLIAGSVVFLLINAVGRLLAPAPVENGPAGIAVMVFSIALTFALVQLQRFVVRRTGSVAISADSLHYTSDLLMNLSVIAALVLATVFDLHYFDPLFAIGVAFFILYSAWRIVGGSFDILLDREFPLERRARIRDLALRHPHVRDVHDMRTRSAGIHSFIQLHLELDGSISLKRAHEISDEVEVEIREAFPNTDVIIHQDPEGVDEERAEFS